MNKPSAAPINALDLPLWCAATGAVMGQVVLGMSARQPDAFKGGVLALIFVLAGAASLLMLMTHLHQTRWRRERPLPVKTWVLALSAGLLATIYFQSAAPTV